MSTLHIKLGPPDCIQNRKRLSTAISDVYGGTPSAVAFKEWPEGLKEAELKVCWVYTDEFEENTMCIDIQNPSEHGERATNNVYIVDSSLVLLHMSMAVAPLDKAATLDEITSNAMKAL